MRLHSVSFNWNFSPRGGRLVAHTPQFGTLPALTPLPACEVERVVARCWPFTAAVNSRVRVVTEAGEKAALFDRLGLVVQPNFLKAFLSCSIGTVKAAVLE